jgi:HK97 family phage major capsid protein
MRTDTRKITGFTVGGDGAPFGVSGGWTAPGATITEREPDTEAIELRANKLAVLTAVHNETIADGVAAEGPSVEDQLVTGQRMGMSWLLDRSFLRGTGVGQPLGILNAPVTITVDKETGQAADSVVYENLTKMFARMHPASLVRAVWVANPTTIPWLLQLSVPVGTGGSHIPVLRENGQGGFTMLTRPCVFTEKAPALGDAGDIGLYDFSQYAIGLRAELLLEKSIHVGFATDKSHYRAILRADGQPTWRQPYTPDSGDTLSPFVILGARA